MLQITKHFWEYVLFRTTKPEMKRKVQEEQSERPKLVDIDFWRLYRNGETR